eukprot:4014802-Amphidinium_carterae.1
MDSIYALRQAIGRLLSHALVDGLAIAGKPLVFWSSLAGYSCSDYVQLTYNPPFRAGTPCDVHLAALILGMSLWLIGDEPARSMCSHRTPPASLLRLDRVSYFVTRMLEDIVCPECYGDSGESLTELAPQLLGAPRTCSMMLLVRSLWPDSVVSAFVDTQYFHSYSAEYACHLRLVLAIPEHLGRTAR